MLLLMGWTEPQEELMLNPKLSEKFPVSRPNFVQYKGTHKYANKCTHNTFWNASVWFVLCGTEFSDLNLSFACPKVQPVSFDPLKQCSHLLIIWMYTEQSTFSKFCLGCQKCNCSCCEDTSWPYPKRTQWNSTHSEILVPWFCACTEVAVTKWFAP